MDHPNIAKVLDAGTTEGGRPYFVMELVKGMPITTYCDKHHLTPRERLELFIPVCQAVQHAHQKGIIHRDLKPSNVMVALYDGQPVPKIIDFGVVKATGPRLTDRTMFTEFGAIIGTLEYMSPEQAEMNQLDVDTRSDIYALGVLLYELLTGTTPLDRKRLKESALHEVLRVIREEEPPKPSTRLSTDFDLPSVAANRGMEPARLSGLVRGELDWIVMKALDKDRNRRYETANGLLRDVERYLADEPVQACPPSATYRFQKYARRHKIALVTSGIVAASLVLGTVVSLWQACWRGAEGRATAEAVKATRISDVLEQMLGIANPESGKRADYTVREMLDDFSTTQLIQLDEQPEIQADIHAIFGNTYRWLGVSDKAKSHLDAALDLRKRLFGPDHPVVAKTLSDYAHFLWPRNVVEQEKFAREAWAIHQKLELENDETVEILFRLQLALFGQRRYSDSKDIFDEAMRISRELSEPPPAMANALNMRAITLVNEGNPTQGESVAREAVTLHRKVHGEYHPETGWGLFFLGRALESAGEIRRS